MWRKGNPSALLVGCRLVQPLWKTVWSYLKKLKMELPFVPVIPLPGICPKKPKTLIQKNVSTPMFTAALFTITKIRRVPKCPSVDEWIKKHWYIYTMECYLAIKKKEILPFQQHGWTWRTFLPTLGEVSQSEKDKYHIISLICGI